MSFCSRGINSRSAACFGPRYPPNIRSSSQGTNNASGCNQNATLGSVTGGTGGFGGAGGYGNGLGGGGGNLSSRYITYIADVVYIILNVRNTPLEDLREILGTLVSYQELLAGYYDAAVDPININYDNVVYQLTNTDPFLYFLFFAYNLCDYQIIQYEMITTLNNSQKRYMDLLNAKASNSPSFNNTSSVNLLINTSIKNEYLKYIVWYGVPKKGYFIPSILERIRVGVINIDNYLQFNPMNMNLVETATQAQEWVDMGAINPIVGTVETITTTVNDNTGTTTTTIIDTDDSGKVLANITIVV